MTGSVPTAFLDANVLYPAPLRDLLMHLALAGACRVHWSQRVHVEWKRNLLKNRPELTRDQLDRTSRLMDEALPHAMVKRCKALPVALQLPDADDGHILAAAIACNASCVVTFNLKDFPKTILAPLNIEAVHPDEFIAGLWSLNKAAVLHAVMRQRAALKNPAYSADKFLETLRSQKLPQTAELLPILFP